MTVFVLTYRKDRKPLIENKSLESMRQLFTLCLHKTENIISRCNQLMSFMNGLGNLEKGFGPDRQLHQLFVLEHFR